MEKILIIVRHAHRDKSQGREVDNGLSKKGQKQAEKILDFYKTRFGKSSPALFSSDKLRCVETVEPLAQKYKVEIAKTPLLMEQGGSDPGETKEEFVVRIQQFINQWKKSQVEITVASTHGDWIPFFFAEYFHSETELKKGGWSEMTDANGLTLTWVIQEFL